MAIWAGTGNVPVGQKLLVILVIILLAELFDKLILFVKVEEKLLRQIMMYRRRCAVINIKRYPKLFKTFFYLGMVFINNSLGRGILFLGLYGDSRAMLIRPANI